MNFPWWKSAIWNGLITLFLPVFLLAALLPGRRHAKLIWGSMPLISNCYWSAAMREAGHDSLTVMQDHYPINKRSDFDRYFEDWAPTFLPKMFRRGIGACLGLVFALRHGKVIHVSFMGFALDNSWYWRLEAPLLRRAGVKIVAMPFGADVYKYSEVIDTSMRHVLLDSYPGLARIERRTAKRVSYWTRQADAVIVGMQVDGVGRWDIVLNQFFHIDTRVWSAKPVHSDHDGRSGPVRILHTPNHRAFKGTEFLLDAVETLKGEGLQVELVLLEKVPNDRVREVMQEVDILGEQFIATGYALSGIEGMASGLPVMANLEHEAYTRLFRRYGFLNECPILSTSPETLTDNLRLLVTQPALRRELGAASRAFAEKYHSYEMAQYMFGKVYERIVDGREVDLIGLFHPLKGEYNRRRPLVRHPLHENKLPADSPYRRC
jgi:glycosyltransferase involved in cell wall biosynthesis